MGLIYFEGLEWHHLTREERVFCAELEFQIRDKTGEFVDLLEKEANLPKGLRGPWYSAYEVCFYRDYLRRFNPRVKSSYSPKRTFDIALFSDEAVIVIEAKAAEVFKADQAKSFQEDQKHLQCLLPEVKVFLVALASKTYFDNYAKVGRGTALKPFDNRHLTWEAVAAKYPNVPLLKRACEVYERSPLAIVEGDAEPAWRTAGDAASEISRLQAEIAQRERAIELLRKKA